MWIEKSRNQPGRRPTLPAMTFWRRLTSCSSFVARSGDERDSAPEPGRDEACDAIGRIYLGWARAHGLAIEQGEGLRVRGSVAGRNVVVDPGVDGRAPGWVQVTVGVALPAAASALVTRATPRRDELTSAVRALFDDADIGAELRAISVAPRHLRLRLAPGASPDVVETAVAAVARALRTLYAPTSDLRHSSTTTVPWPA